MAMPRILTSSKFQASFFQSLLISIPLIFTLADKNLDRDKKQQACNVAIVAIAGVWGIAIHATGREDAAKAVSNTTPTGTTVEVNPQPVMSDEVASTFQDVYKQLNALNKTARPATATYNRPPPSAVQAGLSQNREASGIFRDYAQEPLTNVPEPDSGWRGFKVAPKGPRQ